VFWVPGVARATGHGMALAERGNHDAIVCLGCVIRGQDLPLRAGGRASAAGIMQVSWTSGVRWHLGADDRGQGPGARAIRSEEQQGAEAVRSRSRWPI